MGGAKATLGVGGKKNPRNFFNRRGEGKSGNPPRFGGNCEACGGGF